jgi:hypothetical protein
MVLRPSFANGFAPRDGQAIWPELWRGCVGAWNPGLGPTGLRLYDWSPYKNHGTLTNMDAAGDWVTSQGRYALDFDGNNGYVDLGSIYWPEITVSSWINPRGFGAAYASIFSTFELASGAINTQLLKSNAKLAVYVQGVSGLAFYDGTGATLSANVWYSVIHTYSASVGLRSYLNGVLDGSASSVGALRGSSNTTVWIGGHPSIADRYINGRHGGTQVYNRVLHPNEIRLLATRPGIAYELAPRRWSAAMIEAYRRRTQYAQLVGGGII